MLFKIKTPLYNIPKLAPHFNLFHKAYIKSNGETRSRIITTIFALMPDKRNPKNAIFLSGIVNTTESDINAHKIKTMDRIFNANGIGFQPFINPHFSKLCLMYNKL